MSRLLSRLRLSSLSLLLLLICASALSAASPPNIVYIMSDDNGDSLVGHRENTLKCDEKPLKYSDAALLD